MSGFSDSFTSDLRQVLLVISGPGLLSCANLLPPAPILLFTPKSWCEHHGDKLKGSGGLYLFLFPALD